jgi:hypothetical protein
MTKWKMHLCTSAFFPPSLDFAPKSAIITAAFYFKLFTIDISRLHKKEI